MAEAVEAVIPEYLMSRVITLKVVDAETGKPIPRALITGLKLLVPVPVLPRRTDDEGIAHVYCRWRALALLIYKRGYRVATFIKRVPRLPFRQTYTVRLERRKRV